MHRRTCSKDHGNAGTNSEKAGEKGRDLERPDVSVLTGAVPKEAASISACDPKFFAKDNSSTCNITPCDGCKSLAISRLKLSCCMAEIYAMQRCRSVQEDAVF